MDLRYTEAERQFRDELRAWLRGNRYEPPASDDDDERHQAMLAWMRRLSKGGWLGVHWPVEHGGRGASASQSWLFFEELGRARQPLPANALGLLYGGPTIIARGTPAQQARFLPGILAGDIWCQGFSEPGAGSDLGSLRTAAVRDGDEWVVTGQKIWTSNARHAKWCMLLARTDSGAAKHHGLTYFVMDMQQPGVEVRPLRQMTGESEFAELFLSEARIPHENVVGKVDDGWQVSMSTLGFERTSPAAYNMASVRVRLDDLVREASQRGLLEDPVVVDRLADLHVRTELMRQTVRRVVFGAFKGGGSGAEGSLPKLMVADLYQEVTQLAADLLPDALTLERTWSYDLLRARGRSIEGGTHEIQKNVIAQRVLGLPRST